MSQNKKEFLNKVDESIVAHGFSKNSHPVVKAMIFAGLAVSLIALVNKLRENSPNNFRSYKLSSKATK